MIPKKIIVITGTTSGIGAQTAWALAKNDYTIYMLVRDVSKGEREKRSLLVSARNSDIHIVKCDLSSLQSVHNAVEKIKAEVDSINVLINNAGGVFDTRQLSTDGFELTFAVNHLGHFLLTLGLMPLLQKGSARIINLSSEAHKAAKPNMADWQMEKSYKGIKAYANAKLYNIYFTQLLAQKYGAQGITAYCLHPGIVNTNFGGQYKGFFKLILNAFRPLMITAREGSETIIYLATQPGIEPLSGSYFKKKAVAKTSAAANNTTIAQYLWDDSLAMVKAYL